MREMILELTVAFARVEKRLDDVGIEPDNRLEARLPPPPPPLPPLAPTTMGGGVAQLAVHHSFPKGPRLDI